MTCAIVDTAAAYLDGRPETALPRHAEVVAMLRTLRDAGVETDISVRSTTEMDRLRLHLEELARIQRLSDPCAAREDIRKLHDDLLARSKSAGIMKALDELMSRCGGDG